jgi:hypothetical protein
MKYIYYTSLIFFISCAGISYTHASTTVGTISSANYAWGENFGWINFGCTNCSVQVTDTAVTGMAWSPNYGWINLSPTNGGVINDGNGNLSGTAWSSGSGWISFAGGVISPSSGLFSGTIGNAASTSGRINFSCTNCSVVTDWRGASVRGQGSNTTSSSGNQSTGGSSGGVAGTTVSSNSPAVVAAKITPNIASNSNSEISIHPTIHTAPTTTSSIEQSDQNQPTQKSRYPLALIIAGVSIISLVILIVMRFLR